MKRRIRIAVASVMVAAGLIAVVATPASADTPHYSVVGTCTLSTGQTGVPSDGIFTSKQMNQSLKAMGCVNNTIVFTRVRVP